MGGPRRRAAAQLPARGGKSGVAQTCATPKQFERGGAKDVAVRKMNHRHGSLRLPSAPRKSNLRRVRTWPGSLIPVCLFVAACDPSDARRSVNPIHTLPDANLHVPDSELDAGMDAATVSVSTPPSASDTSRVPGSSTDAVMTLDAGVTRRNILWGLQPGNTGEDAGVVEEALLRLEVIGLGSRILTHVSTGPTDDLEPLRKAPGLNWVITLPFDVFIGMSDAQLTDWVARVWGLGPRSRYLIVGQHLESDLFQLAEAERVQAVGRLTALLDGARLHDNRPVDSAVGLGLGTWVVVPTELIAASDVVALSYSAVETTGAVVSPEEALESVKALAEQVQGYRRPVIFQDLAYPSIEGEEDQKTFFSLLRSWVTQPNLPDVRAVVISSLNPPSPEECAAWAEHWQVPEAEVRCTIGMREGDRQSKGAFNEVVRLLAEFAQL